MIKILYVHGYKGDKYGPSFQHLAKYADAANFAGEKVEMLYNLTRHMYERTDMLNVVNFARRESVQVAIAA